MSEKAISEIPRPIKEQYEKGHAAFERNNLDYALTLLTQVLDQVPEFFDARKTLRATQFKKSGSDATRLRRWRGFLNPKLFYAWCLRRSQPHKALSLIERILNKSPHTLLAHNILAEAALEVGLAHTAVLSLEITYKYKPRNKKIALRLADALAHAGDPGRGESILNELLKVYPTDMKLDAAAKNLSAQKTMSGGGYETATSYRDILKDEQQAVSLEQEQHEVRAEEMTDRLIRENEDRLEQEPQNTNVIEKLAELYEEKGEFHTAAQYYKKIAEIQGRTDPSLQKRIVNMTLKDYDKAITQLDSSNPEEAEKLRQLQKQKADYRIQECEQRVKQYPNDLLMRFELGELYFQEGRYKEAIQELQKAQNNPHRRIQAMNYLGQAFSRRGMHDMAVRTLENALKEKQVFDEEKKSLLYELGCALEKMDRKEEGIEHLKQVYEVDMSYKDVAAKVDAYYGNEQNE